MRDASSHRPASEGRVSGYGMCRHCAERAATPADVLARVAAVEARVAELERGRRPADAAMQRLLVHLADCSGDEFTAEDVAERLRLDPVFAEAADAAGLTADAVEIGYWLRGQRGALVGACTLQRLPGARPARWAFL